MFTQTFIICIILFCFNCYSHAIRFGVEENYLSHLVELLRVTSKHYYISTRNQRITKPPKNGGNVTGILGSVFNVQNYGATGDGVMDDTKAFEAAWTATCVKENGVMLVPSGFTFLLQPIIFNGIKCQPNITVQVEGKIVAPSKMYEWSSVGTQWILFTGFSKGLTIRGHGILNGRGQEWWESARLSVKSFDEDDDDKSSKKRPHAIEIDNSNHVTVTGITIQNSPQMHIYFDKCQYVTIFNLTISSPGDSPNTDGIHLTQTQHVNIYHSTLACGDDCISIQSGCSDVIIQNVNCGPGHGYSIGSLGYGGEEAEVSGIGVYNSMATNTSNGVRIKTWEGATGSVKNITFENIKMTNVENTILIDQYYCNGHEFCKPTGKSSAVVISGVHFKNITGTYAKRSVALICSESEPCKEITVATIDLNTSEQEAQVSDKTLLCSNAYGEVLTKTTPSFEDCLKSDRAVAPATRLEAFDEW